MAKSPPPGSAPNTGSISLNSWLQKLRDALYTLWAEVQPLRSYEVEIGDDEVSEFEPPLQGGFMSITTNLDNPDEDRSGMVFYDVGSTLAISEKISGANLDVSTSDVSGTDGADGNVTVAVQSNLVKVENRSGATCKFRVTFL